MFGSLSSAQAGWAPTLTRADHSASLQMLRPVTNDEVIRVTVVLRLNNQGDFDSRLKELGRTGGGLIAPARKVDIEGYLPAKSSVDAVVAHLARSGFRNIQPAANRLLVTAEGSPAAVRAAFNTSMMHVSRNGAAGIANVTDAQVPAELGGVVLSVLGLQTVDRMRPQFVFGGAPQCITPLPEVRVSPNEPVCPSPGSPPPLPSGLNPVVFQTAYGATSLPTGGLTQIGIIAEGNVAPAIADLQAFESGNGLQTINPSIVLAGPASSDLSGQVEWDVDSQSAQGAAGGQLAGITFYVATSFANADITAALNAAMSAGTTKIVNVSLGECETSAQSDGSAAADDQIFALAVMRGQTFSVATGDSGSAQCAGKTGVSYPASSPYVIAVGGTTLTLGAGGTYASETAWSLGGGGVSTFEPQPQVQNNIVPASLRGLPDIAFDADPSSGVILFNNGGVLGPVGGTSLASPIFVGLFARLQAAANETLPFPAQWIYHFPVGRRAAAFHDITSGSNGAYSAGVGYDFTTGFGSIAAANVHTGIGVQPLADIVSFVLNN